MQIWPGAWAPAEGLYAPDTARMVRAVAQVVGDGQPRLVGTPAAAAGRERIVALLAEAGVALEPQDVHLVRSRAGEVRLTNLVGRIAGTDPDAGTIAVVAHSDSVRVSPGAGDNASGVAAVAEVAHALRARPPRHDVVVLITDGEEAGLLGAEVFMRQHPWAKELQGVVNLDARGASGPAFVFELGPDTRRLVAQMKLHMAAPRTTSLAAWIYNRMPNGTDFMVFRMAGLTGYNAAFIGDHAAYHTPNDTPERLNASTLRHFGHTALALTQALDSLPAVAPHVSKQDVTAGGKAALLSLDTQRAAWTDLAGVFIVSWPESQGPAMACIAIAMVLAPAYWFGARTVPATRAIGLAIGCMLACMAASAALGWGARAGAAAMHIDMRTAPGRTIALTVTIWAAAAVMLAMAAAVIARRPNGGATAAYAAVWTVWCVVACASAFLLPAAAPLLVLPVGLAGVVGLAASVWTARWGCVAARRGASTAVVVAGSLAGTFGAALVWLPWEPAFLDALGLGLAPVAGVRAVLVLSPVLPVAVLCARRREAAH